MVIRTGRSRRRLSIALVSQLLVRGLGVASGVLVAAGLARGLGHEGFGQFSLVLTLVGVAMSIGDLGLNSTVVRHLALYPESQSTTIGALILARIATGVVGAVFVGVTVFVLDDSAAARTVGVLAAATLLMAPLAALQTVGQAKLRLGAQNILLLLQSATWTAAVLILALAGGSMVTFGIAFFVVSAVQSVMTWIFFRGLSPISFRGAGAELRRIARIAAPIVIGGLLVTSYYRIGAVLLYQYQGADQVADYSAAYRFLDILQVVPATLLGAVLPLLSSTWRSDSAEMRRRRDRLFGLALTLLGAAALPLAAGGALVSSRLVRLVYGGEFAGAGPVLAILILSFPAICAGYLAVGLALASGRTVLYCGVSAVAALGSIPANVLLIPLGGGIAAAWTTVATEYVVATALLVTLRRSADVRFPVRAWSGAVAATVAMTLAVAPLRDHPLYISVLVGAAAFGIGAVVFRAVTVADLKALTDRREQDWL